ncbi:hypothetical protein [Streptomyces sp. 900116325]
MTAPTPPWAVSRATLARWTRPGAADPAEANRNEAGLAAISVKARRTATSVEAGQAWSSDRRERSVGEDRNDVADVQFGRDVHVPGEASAREFPAGCTAGDRAHDIRRRLEAVGGGSRFGR